MDGVVIIWVFSTGGITLEQRPRFSSVNDRNKKERNRAKFSCVIEILKHYHASVQRLKAPIQDQIFKRYCSWGYQQVEISKLGKTIFQQNIFS